MFTTEEVNYCDYCDGIFLSEDALSSHKDHMHAYEALGTPKSSKKRAKKSKEVAVREKSLPKKLDEQLDEPEESGNQFNKK